MPLFFRCMKKKILIIGYGNPGRLDDGLGPALAEEIEKLELSFVTVDSDYQLTVEDASYVCEYDVVVFADASVNCPESYEFKEIIPAKETMSFSSHSCSPEAVLGLADQLFQSKVKGYALGIRGYEFNEFGQKLSADALLNLQKAKEFIVEKIQFL